MILLGADIANKEKVQDVKQIIFNKKICRKMINVFIYDYEVNNLFWCVVKRTIIIKRKLQYIYIYIIIHTWVNIRETLHM